MCHKATATRPSPGTPARVGPAGLRRRYRQPPAALPPGPVIAVISACRTENTYNQPGANARIGSVLVRYAHIAEPPDGPWQTGGDAPLYLWLYNEGDRPDTLLGAGTAVAESVVIIGPDGGRAEDRLPLPPREPTELEEGSTPMVLRDLRQQIRGGDPSGSRLPAQAANGAEPVARR